MLISQPEALNQIMLGSLSSFSWSIFVKVVEVVEIMGVQSDYFFVDSSILGKGVVVFVDEVKFFTN